MRTAASKPSTKTATPPRSHAATCLAKLGLQRAIDLVLHLPLRYDDETTLTDIAHARKNFALGQSVQIEGIVQSHEISRGAQRQLLIHIADKSGALLLRFLHFYNSQLQQMAVGVRLRARGEIRSGFFGCEMVHPICKIVEEGQALPQTLTPVYPTTAGLGQAYLRKAISSALTRTPLSETVPAAVLTALPMTLWPFAQAVQFLHHPPHHADLNAMATRTHPAWGKIKFDELLAQQLSLKRHYDQRYARHAPPLITTDEHIALSQRLIAELPFTLTHAQQKVWDEIRVDLARVHPMQRLLQGDVGCGKTIISALAAAQAIDCGYQVALMVPTELLAEQHFRKLSTWLTPLGVHIVLLSGNTRIKEKRHVHEQMSNGEAQLIIGTHALIQKEVKFFRLGLVIVDEQHRFGVDQRLALRQLGHVDKHFPHQLIMSATPIPRTLAMTYYTDLDISIIDALPPGRTPVLTRVINNNRRTEIIERVRAAANEGRQIYWVCPLIEESEKLQLQTAIETADLLRQALPELSIGLIHGRLSAAEKATLMASFVANQLQLLVATTVIEVGVDVANASLMIIEHAERFGLAQLHQLRGRVGRGSTQSACVLLYQSPLSIQAKQRLSTMRDTNDGFIIAQRDLEIRGPGEFFGARQSGQALLRFADLATDSALIAPAREAAKDMLEKFPHTVDAHLDRWLNARTNYLEA